MYEHWAKAQRAFQPGRKLSLGRNEVSCDGRVGHARIVRWLVPGQWLGDLGCTGKTREERKNGCCATMREWWVGKRIVASRTQCRSASQRERRKRLPPRGWHRICKDSALRFRSCLAATQAIKVRTYLQLLHCHSIPNRSNPCQDL